MTSTKSKPAGRAVKVRKTWISANDFIRSRMPLHENDQQCIIITGYTGSAKTLKRLVEIAGMDEVTLAKYLSDKSAISFYAAIDVAKALGLSTAQGRKGEQS